MGEQVNGPAAGALRPAGVGSIGTLATINKKASFFKSLASQWELVLMAVPLVLYIVLFTYVPLWGWSMAFQNYKPQAVSQQWVGLKWFHFLFQDSKFLLVLRNTLCMSLINLVFSYLSAIALALILNECRNRELKKVVQTISYLPHFLSWVIVSNMVATALASDGIVNILLGTFGILKQPVQFLGVGEYFWWIVGFANVWKEVGFNSIIYLAAIAAIDPNLYEAAELDGCGRLAKIWYITLPGIKPTIMVLLIMSIGHIMDAGFEVQYLLENGQVVDFSQTIDIYVLKYGLQQGNFSLATAAGMFKSVVNIIILFLANSLAKRMGEERLI